MQVGIPPRTRFGVAVTTFVVSVVFGTYHLGVFNLHEFVMMKVLSYQAGQNMTHHLFAEVRDKLWET